MDSPKWRFRDMTPGEMNIDPIEGEFFSTEALHSGAEALVRETIQNSLDAAAGPCVRVSVRLSTGEEAMRGEARDRYLADLLPHLKARGNGLLDVPRPGEPMGFLVVEDFGTRGLQGDVRQYEDAEDGTGTRRNDFYYFWRNIGRSSKSTQDLGRWGLGKTVFQAASRINSFFGLTVRRGDPRPLLMGQSVLKIHRIEGRRHAPYGYYALFEDGFPLPVEEPALAARFAEDFALERRGERAGEPGLSVVVPYPERDVRLEDLMRSVVEHYFFPILKGALVVEFRRGAEGHLFDARQMPAFLEDCDWEDRDRLLGRIELARWGIDLPASRFTRLAMPAPAGRAPRWREDLFPAGDLDRLRARFDAGERVALDVPITVRRKGGRAQETSYQVLLERDGGLERPEDFFIRMGITVAGVTSLRQSGVRAIVAVYDRPLSTLLGDAENPAHTQWQERSARFRGRYVVGPSCLRFVKSCPREVVRFLSAPVAGRDEELLGHLFYLQVPAVRPGEAEGPEGAPGPGEGPEAPAEEPAGVPGGLGPQPLRLTPVKGGFRLALEEGADGFPLRLRVAAAYEVRQGDPFKKYHPLDFRLGRRPLSVEVREAEVLEVEDNRLLLEVLRPGFELAVSGFDPRRDLKVRVDPEDGAGEGEA